MAKSNRELRRVRWARLANLLPNDTEHFRWVDSTDHLYCVGVDVDWCEHDLPVRAMKATLPIAPSVMPKRDAKRYGHAAGQRAGS